MSSIVKVVGKRCLEKSFIVLWSVFLFYASFSQWLAETDFWKSPRVYIHKNYTSYQPWYAQQVSRLILLWSSAAGVKFSFGQWGGDHWLKLTSEVFFCFQTRPLLFLYLVTMPYWWNVMWLLHWSIQTTQRAKNHTLAPGRACKRQCSSPNNPIWPSSGPSCKNDFVSPFWKYMVLRSGHCSTFSVHIWAQNRKKHPMWP